MDKTKKIRIQDNAFLFNYAIKVMNENAISMDLGRLHYDVPVKSVGLQ